MRPDKAVTLSRHVVQIYGLRLRNRFKWQAIKHKKGENSLWPVALYRKSPSCHVKSARQHAHIWTYILHICSLIHPMYDILISQQAYIDTCNEQFSCSCCRLSLRLSYHLVTTAEICSSPGSAAAAFNCLSKRRELSCHLLTFFGGLETTVVKAQSGCTSRLGSPIQVCTGD